MLSLAKVEAARDRVDEVVTVTDNEIALAAVLAERFEFSEDELIVPILSGGNIELNDLTTVVMRGLVQMGRYLKIRTELKDRPGSLQQLVDSISEHQANIYAVQHDRTSRDIAMNAAEVVLDLETHGHDHVEALLTALETRGYEIEKLV